ncbi:MAG: hypothetical protein JWP12_1473 [Bacteroidetes bacterium]|nr:hypothetical protein [Bacteroidota bacterium]
MKILILSDINSAHTQKWTVALAQKGLEIAIFSLTAPESDWYLEHGIMLFGSKRQQANSSSKLGYLKSVPALKSAIASYQPQVVHAHYATSYGLLGALTGFHPFVISAWGSDVMEFPHKNFINKKILKYNFKKADAILATSQVLVDEIGHFSAKKVFKIPFGIDINFFKPAAAVNPLFPEGTVVIGTVKSLESIYGTDILIAAFKKIRDKYPDKKIKLLVVGGGSKEQEYKALTTSLNLDQDVVFTGKVKYENVLNYHNMIDIFVNVSRNESFGVAVLEAAACEKVVIASNIGGLTEVVKNGTTGFLVAPENIQETADAIEELILNEFLRVRMGKAGRVFVQKQFDFSSNVEETYAVYKQVLTK